MATHNQVRLVGYITGDPIIQKENVPGEERVLFCIRVLHRQIEDYHQIPYTDVVVICREEKLLKRMKKLKKLDLIDIKGFYNVSVISKGCLCKNCGHKKVMDGKTNCFVYPIWFNKIDSLQQAENYEKTLPEKILKDHFEEVSNQAFIMGNVVAEPEILSKGKENCCRYQVAIERKYHIRCQDDIRTDFPYIYSYGKQAVNDMLFLKQGALVMADCFIRNRRVKMTTECPECGYEMTYYDMASELVPYSVEYLRGHFTPEEAEKRREEKGLEKA